MIEYGFNMFIKYFKLLILQKTYKRVLKYQNWPYLLELWEVANGLRKAGLVKDTLEVSAEFIKGWFVLLFCFVLYPTGIEKCESDEERQLSPTHTNISLVQTDFLSSEFEQKNY